MIKQSLTVLPDERIINKIYFIRGKKVMFDRDLAELYGVSTMALNQAVKRNTKRFPSDFMFKLSKQEMKIWISHFVISKDGMGRSRSQSVILKRGQNLKYAPTVFTEQGVAMLSSVLRSDRAIMVNLQIIRTFTKLRELLSSHKDLREKLEAMERRYDKQFGKVFEAIAQLLQEKNDIPESRRISFTE